MKATKGHIINSNTLKHIRIDADKVITIQTHILVLQDKLSNIEVENRWLHYLGADCTKTLTQDECLQLNNAIQTITYAERIN